MSRPDPHTTPAEQAALDCITGLLADRVLTGTKYEGHTVAPPNLSVFGANRAISDLAALPYPDNGCRGGECTPMSQCSRHSQEYQRRYGRAWNE